LAFLFFLLERVVVRLSVGLLANALSIDPLSSMESSPVPPHPNEALMSAIDRKDIVRVDLNTFSPSQHFPEPCN
jgi:hypothetical protein